MINIGFRAHDFGKFSSIEELATAASSVKDPAFIQLALGKSLINARPWQEWDEEYIHSISQKLMEKNVSIAVIGCYINPVCPDEDKRKLDLQRFEKSLSLTSAFGCSVVGTETGSYSLDNSYTIKTTEDKVFTLFQKSLDQMLNAAIKHNAICAIEPVSKQHTLCSIERTARILEGFKDEHLKVIYDAINLLPWTGLAEEDGAVKEYPTDKAVQGFTNEALDAFGDRIVAIHCKDYRLDEKGWKIGDLPAPKGVFNWSIVFRELLKRKISVPILLENFNKNTVKEDLIALEKF